MTEPSAVPGDALEDIAYLSRSENRVKILDALTTRAYPRRELEEATGTSRTTLGRILSEFEDRGWAKRAADGDYVATPQGEHVAAEFTPLVGAMETIETLGDAIAGLPIGELSIGLHHFSDATVRRPDANEPVKPVRRLTELLREASTFHALTFLSPPLAVGNAMHDSMSAGSLSGDHVLTGGLVEHMRERPEGPPPWADYIEAGARIYRYEGRIPCNLFVVDDIVLIANDRSDANEFIESDDDTVREWALELIEAYREDAERLEAEAFA